LFTLAVVTLAVVALALVALALVALALVALAVVALALVTLAVVTLGYKGYKDDLQPKSLADGNWLVKQNQPVSKIETKSDTKLRSLCES
jgi:membrane protein implicated in regulation of membrane protease activity